MHILSKKKKFHDSSTYLTLLLQHVRNFWPLRSATRAWRRTTYTTQLSKLPKPRPNSMARCRHFLEPRVVLPLAKPLRSPTSTRPRFRPLQTGHPHFPYHVANCLPSPNPLPPHQHLYNPRLQNPHPSAAARFFFSTRPPLLK